MPVISLVNSKGGVGKSTTALILAQVFSKNGAAVTLIDADPNQPMSLWKKRDEGKVPNNLKVVGDVTENNIVDIIDDAVKKDPFVIVDLEGSANMTASIAIGRSDLVLIPMRGSQLDADQAERVIKLIHNQSKLFHRNIPYTVVFTCTSVLQGKDFRYIKEVLQKAGIPVLPVEITERAAFRAIMQLGGTIYDLTKAEVTNPEAAIENAEAVAEVVANILRKEGEAAA